MEKGMTKYTAFFCVLLSNVASLRAQTPPEKAPPSLILRDLQGRERRLADYRGKIVVLNFWATWCTPCLKEMPLLVSLQTRYADKGVQVIAASADDDSTKAQIPAFVKKLKMNFPVWVGATTEHMQNLGLGSALPATAFIDRDGKILDQMIGTLEKGNLERLTQWILGDRSGSSPSSSHPSV
jgi:thiol-disulfide isomerase/thioredoxin